MFEDEVSMDWLSFYKDKGSVIIGDIPKDAQIGKEVTLVSADELYKLFKLKHGIAIGQGAIAGSGGIAIGCGAKVKDKAS
jgi:hypothetical protein